MAVKTTQWLALAMLLSVAVAAMAARQEDAPAAKPTDAAVDASISAKKHKDNYHKDDYHKDDYNKGGEYYNKGGEYYNKGGEYYNKGGEYYNKGGEYYNKGEYYPDGGYHPNGDYYPGKSDYYGGEYPNGEYPHDYGYDHGFQAPSLKDEGVMAECPFALGTKATCTVTCPQIAGYPGYPFGCFAKASGTGSSEASVKCPHGRATDCSCGCTTGAGAIRDCGVVSISGGFRNACWVRCSTGEGQVSAACK